MLFLSCFNQERIGDYLHTGVPKKSETLIPQKIFDFLGTPFGGALRNATGLSIPTRGSIMQLHEESIDRIVDILCKGKTSEVIKESPMGAHTSGGALPPIAKL